MWIGAQNVAYGPVTTFTTNFNGANENPLSDGGRWLKPASGWQNLRRVSNLCKAAAYTESFDDAHSLCQVLAPANAEVIVTLFRQNATFGEYGILFRITETAGSPGTAQAYECLCNSDGGVDVVRWNGAQGSFLSLLNTSNSPGSIADGDQLRATCIGNGTAFITFYWRRPSVSLTWTQIATSVADANYTSGRCSPNNYIHATGGNIDDLGYRDFTLNAL